MPRWKNDGNSNVDAADADDVDDGDDYGAQSEALLVAIQFFSMKGDRSVGEVRCLLLR